MTEPEFLQVSNWKKYQHYLHRNPPWVKLHTELLLNYKFSRLQDASKLLAIYLLLFAAKFENKIPNDIQFVRETAKIKSDVSFDELLLSGFLEPWSSASTVHASASKLHTNALSESESEAETEPEKKAPAARGDVVKAEKRSAYPDTVEPGLNVSAWNDWMEWRSKSKKPLSRDPKFYARAQKVVVGFGSKERQAAVINHSIDNGYQGLFPDKIKSTEPKMLAANMTIEDIKRLAIKT